MPTSKTKSKLKTVYTKAEQKSARIHIQMSYYDATIKKRIRSTWGNIKLDELGTHDFNSLEFIVKTYGK